MEFFGKFVLCSNNERNPVLIEAAETRYWVRRVPPLPYDDQHLLAKMRAEIPGLLFYLQQRTLSSYEESRMWFAPRLLVTDAPRRIVHYNRSKTETEMLSIIHDIMEAENLAEYRFDVSDMVNMLEIRGIRVDHPSVRRILAETWRRGPHHRLTTNAIRLPTTAKRAAGQQDSTCLYRHAGTARRIAERCAM